MSQLRTSLPEKEAPTAQPAAAPAYGNSGEGAASVLRAMRQRRSDADANLEARDKQVTGPSDSQPRAA